MVQAIDSDKTPTKETVKARYLSPYMKYGPKEKETKNGEDGKPVDVISDNRGTRAQTTLCAPYWTLEDGNIANYAFKQPKFTVNSKMGVDPAPTNKNMFRGDGFTVYWCAAADFERIWTAAFSTAGTKLRPLGKATP